MDGQRINDDGPELVMGVEGGTACLQLLIRLYFSGLRAEGRCSLQATGAPLSLSCLPAVHRCEAVGCKLSKVGHSCTHRLSHRVTFPSAPPTLRHITLHRPTFPSAVPQFGRLSIICQLLPPTFPSPTHSLGIGILTFLGGSCHLYPLHLGFAGQSVVRQNGAPFW